jgi:hypothetical protein
MWVRIISCKFKVLETELINVPYAGVDLHYRQRTRFPAYLQLYLLDMVAIDM